MSFTSGRISFTRLHVGGRFPKAVDQDLLDKLSEHSFTETSIGAPSEVEAGFVTGDHIFDTRFSYEKNGFGDRCLFALRIDTHQVPSDVKKAYRLMNEQTLAGDNPSGFASKEQKQEAMETAEEQVRGELASGKHRRSKMIPILWDLRNQALYCGSSGNKPLEILCTKMREAFGADMSIASSGYIASELLGKRGLSRNYDDLQPSRFTNPPAAAINDMGDDDGRRDIETPQVPWMYRAFDEKDFVGNEFLLWLWWQSENGSGDLEIASGSGTRTISIVIDNNLDMDCAWGSTGRQSLRGRSVARLPEAAEGLRIGKWPRKVGMILADGADQWELTLSGDTLTIGGARLPEVTDVGSRREFIEGRLEYAVDLVSILEGLFSVFIDQRVSEKWLSTSATIRQWISTRRRAGKGA